MPRAEAKSTDSVASMDADSKASAGDKADEGSKKSEGDETRASRASRASRQDRGSLAERKEKEYVDPDIGKRGAIADQLVYRSTDFEILETLGTGTFSRVKLVRNVMEDRMRVAKIIRKSDIIGHDLFKYVSMEVKLLRTLDHPFIIKSLGKYQDEESLVIIFELLRGGDLHRRLSIAQDPDRTLHERDRVDAGGMDERHVKFYCTQIVTALQHMHAQRIIYRGVKPENCVVDDDGYVVLVDLGLCTFLPFDDKGKVCKTYTLCGTPEYTSPEVILRNGYGREADVWSVGVLVYELLTGYPPFYGSHAFEVYRKIQEGKYEFPKKVKGDDGLVYPGFGGGLRAKNFVASCLQKNVKKRRGREDGAANGKLRKDWWFYGTDWKKITRRTCEFKDVPFVPSLDRGQERVNFDEFVVEEDVARKLRPLEPEDVEELDSIVQDRSTPPGTPFHLRSKRDSEDEEEEEDEGSVHLDAPLTLEAEAPPDAGFAAHAIKPDSDEEDE